MRRIRRRLVVGFLLVICAIVARGCVFRPATHYPGGHFNRGSNAIWLGVEWVNKPHTADEIAALAEDLQRRQIRSVFVYTSYLRADGEFNETYQHAPTFITSLRRVYPEVHILAWVGLPLKSSGSAKSYHVELSDGATRRKIVEFCIELVSQIGFDGVHLDPEPVSSGDHDLLTLLDELRAASDSGALLSIAARRIWPVYPDAPWPLVGQVSWRGDFYRKVASRVDQMAVMVYDSGLPLAWMYRQWVKFEVISISQAVEGEEVELLIGIPTSEEATVTHHPTAENMRSGLEGTINGLNDRATHPKEIDGIAIYPAWETSEGEWAVYESLWLGIEHPPRCTTPYRAAPSPPPASDSPQTAGARSRPL